MSHHQDQNIALWVERGEVLGELLKELRNSAAALTSTNHAEKIDASLLSKRDTSAGLVDQHA